MKDTVTGYANPDGTGEGNWSESLMGTSMRAERWVPDHDGTEIVGESHLAARADHSHNIEHLHPQFARITYLSQELRTVRGQLGMVMVVVLVELVAVLFLLWTHFSG